MHAVVQRRINPPLPNQEVCVWARVKSKVRFFWAQYQFLRTREQSPWPCSFLQLPGFNSSATSPLPPPPISSGRSLTTWVTILEIITTICLSFFFFIHAQLSHLHIWMTRPAGLFNHQELLRRAITEAAFVLALLLLAERRRCHKANQFETMMEQHFFSFWRNIGNKVLRRGGRMALAEFGSVQ